MRVRGNLQPNVLDIEEHPRLKGYAMVKIRENIVPFAETDTNGTEVFGYEYDEYSMPVKFYSNLQHDIESAFDSWIATGKSLEFNDKSSEAVRISSESATRKAALEVFGVADMDVAMDEAKRIRAVVEKISPYADDATALEAPEIFPQWKAGEYVKEGERRYHPATKKLYKVKEGQSHTTQEDWPPNLTPAMWSVVALPDETGTADNPIEAARGMEYEYGKYYFDPEDGNTYLCKRENEIGTITLDHMPHELVLHYLVLVE